jgi:hypothetical protein
VPLPAGLGRTAERVARVGEFGGGEAAGAIISRRVGLGQATPDPSSKDGQLCIEDAPTPGPPRTKRTMTSSLLNAGVSSTAGPEVDTSAGAAVELDWPAAAGVSAGVDELSRCSACLILSTMGAMAGIAEEGEGKGG